ncbi:MAG: HAMP domain-containing histidine kinase [Bacteroidia bacterium]|nr:HAMP domain-containing histidine kinase [Bacteroidia bacterium]NND25262.1 HAMP domain-containing histidine kinase [Flavobacteriaceae bacterium]MBT8277474.1 HAMP domain-containing histidine kinase [Bacteroidia bacterium]NNK61093.1 HAMP domain-containing histidine kinase [Flavobacteriaceae bacterium]NNL32814.1 HAMP domain-containing histidine kinase [Flavobacteriaceae bacterium]
MLISNNRNVIRWIIILTSFVIISLILWNTYVFFQNFKAEERTKMGLWSDAYTEINDVRNLDDDIGDLPLKTMQSNTSTPMIWTDEKGNIRGHKNLPESVTKDSLELKRLILRFEKENVPVEVKYEDTVKNLIYYGNSPLLNKLKYYPLALLLIIVLFGSVVFFFYRSSKIATQNKLWSGMAKETAHQIGTPLSSLVGWTEILKSENVNPDHIKEIEKDILRLQTITDRFSKIGSMPTLEKVDVVKITQEAYDYLKSRSSKLINFNFTTPTSKIYVDLNEQLYGWTIENLVKNGIDAMKGKGDISITIDPSDKYVNINVSDSGKGIPRHLHKTIFDPGYTSKKRGWGLGLSLSKRIVEDYHKGKLKVLHSETDKGTTMQISLKLSSI